MGRLGTGFRCSLIPNPCGRLLLFLALEVQRFRDDHALSKVPRFFVLCAFFLWFLFSIHTAVFSERF